MAGAGASHPVSGAPIRGSRKAHIQGSRPDLRVPVREILLSASPTSSRSLAIPARATCSATCMRSRRGCSPPQAGPA